MWSNNAGDSGGPLLDTNNVQVGIISWGGLECADPHHAGVAARVDRAMAWIDEQICRLSAMPPASCHPDDTISLNNKLPELYNNETTTFDLRVTVQHDLAPEETSWSFTHVDSFSLLYWQPFRDFPVPFVAVNKVFPNLVAGSYEFAISDQDGICCGYVSTITLSMLQDHVTHSFYSHLLSAFFPSPKGTVLVSCPLPM